jgi:hypothetical protein
MRPPIFSVYYLYVLCEVRNVCNISELDNGDQLVPETPDLFDQVMLLIA